MTTEKEVIIVEQKTKEEKEARTLGEYKRAGWD